MTDEKSRNRDRTSVLDEIDFDRELGIENEEENEGPRIGPEDPYGELKERAGGYGYESSYEANGQIHDEFDRVTNFTLRTEAVVDTYEGEILRLTVIPDNGSNYEVEVSPTVFNEGRKFREEVVSGLTTTFVPSESDKSVGKILSDLRMTVALQEAPRYEGTEHIGYHDGEWVAPSGVIRSDGWTEESDRTYYSKGDDGSVLEDHWELDPEDGSNYDSDEVAEICKTIPSIRQTGRIIPVIGWYYAAPLKPIIQEIEGQYNLMQISGGTGSGKTTTLETMYELFGSVGSPFSCNDTRFTLQKKISGSRGLPIWLDEYKPAQMSSRQQDWLHDLLRKTMRGSVISKGTPDLGEIRFNLRAPVVFSGEQTVQEPAVRRRCIMVQFSSESTSGEYKDAYQRLRSLDLDDHAIAYYQWICDLDESEIIETWEGVGEKIGEYLDVESLDESEKQGLKTVMFGTEMFRIFAQCHGLAPDQIPDKDDIRNGLDHVVDQIGPDGRRREHVDDFIELMSSAATDGYLEEDVHYRIVNSRKYGGECLYYHMPSTYSSVKRYVRDYNLEDDQSILQKSDYLDNLDDKSDDPDSYSQGINVRVNGLENGSKAAVVDLDRAAEVLGSGFVSAAFRDDQQTDHEDDSQQLRISTLLGVIEEHGPVDAGEIVKLTGYDKEEVEKQISDLSTKGVIQSMESGWEMT